METSHKIRVGIMITSDRSYKNERPDATTPLLTEKANQMGWNVVKTCIVPDEIKPISETLMDWCDRDQVDIILTSGGTGFSPRDVTPEATLAVLERFTPGFPELMRAEGLKSTPHSTLSRATAGIRKTTIIINLPGSPKGAVENLSVISGVLPHAIELLKNSPTSESGHNPSGSK
jgi:molybdopterin adenylyltransferase